MPTIDLGTVKAFVNGGRVDVYFPRGYDGLRQVLGRMRARWNPERRCWTLLPGDEGAVGRAIDAIRARLAADAPDGWTAVVERFGGYACASRKYELKVGVGGLRIVLPPGHPGEWTLKHVQGAQRDADRWLLPAASTSSATMRPLLERIVREDRECFLSHVEPYEGRTIRGICPVDEEAAARVGLEIGNTVFADYAFLKVADPQVYAAPIHSWPLEVVAAELVGDGVLARLAYLPPDAAYRAVRSHQAEPIDTRRGLLDLVHATGKWVSGRSSRG